MLQWRSHDLHHEKYPGIARLLPRQIVLLLQVLGVSNA
jgi:hypothetical protein